MAQRVRWVRGTFGRLAPLIATLGGLALGTMAWQLWIQRMVPGSRSNFTEFYKTRVFQADYFKDVVNNLQNPLTQERPISIMDPSYGLFAMSLLEATFLWGTVLVAFGLFRRRAGEAARLARSGVSAIVVGAVVLFAYAAARATGSPPPTRATSSQRCRSCLVPSPSPSITFGSNTYDESQKGY